MYLVYEHTNKPTAPYYVYTVKMLYEMLLMCNNAVEPINHHRNKCITLA